MSVGVIVAVFLCFTVTSHAKDIDIRRHVVAIPGQHKKREANPIYKKVAITGIGVVSGVGLGTDSFWTNLCDGMNPIANLPNITQNFPVCRIKEFNESIWYNNKNEAKRHDRYSHLAMAATKIAYYDSNINISKIEDPYRVGIILGTGIGGLQWTQREMNIFRKTPRRVHPLTVPAMISNICPGSIAIELGIKGPSLTVVTACASGTNAIGEAFKKIKHGEMDVMIAGGTEAAINEFVLTAFDRLGAIAKDLSDPSTASRPFDSLRSGFVMGEGSGILILEEKERAIRRGAKIYGYIQGYGSTSDAYHITAPGPTGEALVKAIEDAIMEAGISKADIEYINAHGTSTALNDRIETAAYKQVFGQQAMKIYISSTKSMTGHCLGGAGGIEAVVSIKALQTGIIPPTINYLHPDPKCDLFYCPNKKVVKGRKLKATMSTSLGFGGHNAVLIFSNV